MADPFTPKFVDLVKNITTTVGTGDLALGAAATGFTSFTSALQSGDRFYYACLGIDKPAEREVGRGTLLPGGKIAREPVDGIKTNFTSGNKAVALIAAAEWHALTAASASQASADAASALSLSSGHAPRIAALEGDVGALVVQVAGLDSELDGTSAELAALSASVAALGNGGSGGGGSAAPAFVATRSALASTSTSTNAGVLTESGRMGVFVWEPSDQSAIVAVDPRQGVSVAPASAPSGAQGAWLRRHDGIIDVRWFGYVADDNGTTGTDNAAAINAAVAVAEALSTNASGGFGTIYRGAPSIRFPAGAAYTSATIQPKCTVTLKGAGGLGSGAGTRLRFGAGVTAILMCAYNTPDGSSKSGSSHAGSLSVIEDIAFEGAYNGANAADCHGLHLRTVCHVNRCSFVNFQGDGLYSVCSLGGGGALEGNSSSSRFTNVTLQNCRNGIVTGGADSSNLLFDGCSFNGNRVRGVDDGSFLGNHYSACHFQANPVAAFRTTNINAPTVFTACYVEPDCGPCDLAEQTLVFGGTIGVATSGGSTIRNSVNEELVLKSASGTTQIISDVGTTTLALNSTGGQQRLSFIESGVDWYRVNAQRSAQVVVTEMTADGTMYYNINGNGIMSLDGYGLNLGANKNLRQNGTVWIDHLGKANPSIIGAYTGDVTKADGGTALTIANDAVTYAKVQNVAAGRLVGNPTATSGDMSEISLGADLSFVGSVLQTGAFTGDVTKAAGSTATSIASATVVAKIAAQAIAPANVAASGAITSSGGKVGYDSGAGGTVTQATSKTTAVTLHKSCGEVTVNGAALAANSAVMFTLTNSLIEAGDRILVNHKSGGTFGAYLIDARAAAGSATIMMRNVTATSLSEAIVIGFAVFKAVTA